MRHKSKQKIQFKMANKDEKNNLTFSLKAHSDKTGKSWLGKRLQYKL